MKSGLEGRNNSRTRNGVTPSTACLNEVRPRRPEQYISINGRNAIANDVSMKSGLEGRNNLVGWAEDHGYYPEVSMKSGLEGRNNVEEATCNGHLSPVSMKSGLEGRNNSDEDWLITYEEAGSQ